MQEDEEGLSLTGNGRSSGDESGWKQVYIITFYSIFFALL
jgi:hypothetical protein